MKHVITLMILLSLAACAEQFKQPVGEIMTSTNDDQGIVGGRNVELLSEDAGKAVLIIGKLKDKSYLCTGSMIADDIVLTAAHCLGDPKNIKIVFGADPVNMGAEQITKLKTFVIHKNYNPKLIIRNDIALIQTEEKKPKNYQIARLPWEAQNLSNIFKIKTSFTVMGYGTITGLPTKDKTDLRGSGTLRKTELNLTKFSLSQDVFYADQSQGRAVCFGDSGGPAFVDANTIVGMVSYNIIDDPSRPDTADEDVCNYQSVFTNIMRYKTWILGGIKSIRNLQIKLK